MGPISHDVGSRFIAREHYAAGAAKTSVYRHGMFKAGDLFDEQCVGVALWMPAVRNAAIATYPENPDGVLALSRLAILEDVPRNAASFLLGRSMRLIDRRRWPCLVTYADTRLGHTGAIYRATNWQYVGLTRPSPAWILEGRQVALKAGPKSRTIAEMESLGAVFLGMFRKHKFIHLENR